jgi:hypothetical protein
MMPMSFKCATYIVVTNLKLTELLEKAKEKNASDAIISDIRGKLDALEPHSAEANNIVIARSDAEFASLAKKVSAQTNKIDAAIADIKRINAALTAASQLITQITKLLALVP